MVEVQTAGMYFSFILTSICPYAYLQGKFLVRQRKENVFTRHHDLSNHVDGLSTLKSFVVKILMTYIELGQTNFSCM
jgi:hypothetical protein